MSTQEERITALEKSIVLLQKRFDDADIQSVNHNAAMLLGMAYGQQADIREIKVQLREARQDIYDLSAKVDEHTSTLNGHTATLNEHTALLHQILARLPEKP